MGRYTLGIDYGTNSVRTVVVDCRTGEFIGSSVFDYPSGDQGIILDGGNHHLARQHPADYLAGLKASVLGALDEASGTDGFQAAQVIGIGVDTTGSTPLPVDKNNVPLALSDSYRDNPAAMAWLWKDHTGADEADRITKFAAEHRPQYLAKCGNTYSSEWFWSKIWKCLNVAPDVFDATYSWVELADFIPSVLAGVSDPTKIVRGVCQAGHKGLYCRGATVSIRSYPRQFRSLAQLENRRSQKPHPVHQAPTPSTLPDSQRDADVQGDGSRHLE